MNYMEMKKEILKLQNEDCKEFVKAILSIEFDIENKIILESIYDIFMNNDSMTLLNEEFYNIVENHI